MLQDCDLLAELEEECSQRIDEVTRRRFMQTAAATAGVTPAAAGLLFADSPVSEKKEKPPRQRNNLFFNFSHEPDHTTAEYYVVTGKNRYRLRRVAPNDHVVSLERSRNNFLQLVPDYALTHVLEGATEPTGVQVCYTVKNPMDDGTWSLSSMFTQIPLSGLSYAYGLQRQRIPLGPLPMSTKRKLYGHPPALNLQDLYEETVVVDTSDHASTLISLHPSATSGESNSAAHIHTNWIQPNGATVGLAQVLQGLGDAQPQVTPNAPNGNGWATLVPLTDDNNQPVINQNGNNKGLIQYYPDWNSSVDAVAGSAALNIVPNIQNDESLGADVTDPDVLPNAPTGKLWARHDGFATIDQSDLAAVRASDSGTLQWTLVDQSVDQGFLVTAAVTQQDGGVQVVLTCANWYLRWLGVYLQFIGNDGMPIAVANLPPNTIPGNDPKSNTDNALFGSMVSPEFTILAIPVAAGTATITFNLPSTGVQSVLILGSGLGSDSNNYPDTVVDGAVMTVLMNFGLTTFFLFAGASDKFSAFQRTTVFPIAKAIAAEMATLIAADIKNRNAISDPGTWKNIGLTLAKNLANYATNRFIGLVLAAIIFIVTESTFEDAIPIAGQILRFISMIVGIADLAHTLTDVLISPWTYIYQMTFTHDVTLKILPDENNNVFPENVNYYKVNALLGNGGTPITQTIDLPSNNVDSVTVTFKNVPWGGQINLSTGFYAGSSGASPNDVLYAKGTTGLVDNTVDSAPDLRITQFKTAIQSSTVYTHKQKTTLQADGSHLWTPTPTAPSTVAADIECGGVGTLCDFRNISVRQGTATQQGYVGYAWKSYSANVSRCGPTGGAGQFDQMANINTGATAQSGYANGACGLNDGAKVAYNLLSHSSLNFYLDSNAGIVRQVQLDPPSFTSPAAQQNAWGKLNFASTALLLHPAGRLVNVSQSDNQMETLKIPAAGLSDDDASNQLIFQVRSGQGSRPGLIDSPVAAAVSPDGVILLLEQNNNRIQAFDTGANPVQFFAKQQRPYFLNLDATASGDTVYLDLAVEFTGYIYVLSYNQSSNLYRLDVYHPSQSTTAPISTTLNFNAAKIAVDFWRNVYALNYEILTVDGQVPAQAEPSISLWFPQD